jgi:hypothetical protein
MGYNPVPMLTINKLTDALRSLATYRKPVDYADADFKLKLTAMIASETLKETAPEIDAIKNGTLLTV